MGIAQRQGTHRTLQILIALGHHPDSTVTMIRDLTGISRPAIYRILSILIDLGYVARRANADTYALTSRIRTLTDCFRDQDRMLELVRPILVRLQKRITWPTDFVCYEDGVMVCKDSTRRTSPLVLERDDIGARIPLLRSAVGIAYLAFSAPATREIVLDTLRRSSSPHDALAHDATAVDQLLTDARKRGYGIRDCTYRPRTCSIAVPVLLEERVLGCISIEFMRSAIAPAEAADRYFLQLRAAADELLSAFAESEGAVCPAPRAVLSTAVRGRSPAGSAGVPARS
jgi:IclR family mhp operon transcriptional activator